MRRSISLVLVCIALFLAGKASATDDIDTEVAKRHFRKGSEFYMAGQYNEALGEFQAAHLAKPLPAFYYNIARCFDRLERFDEAITAYQAYLDAGPAAQDVEKVKARIDKLRERAIAYAKLRSGAAPEVKPGPVPVPIPVAPVVAAPVAILPAAQAPKAEPKAAEPLKAEVPAKATESPVGNAKPLAEAELATPLIDLNEPALNLPMHDQPTPPRRRVATWIFTTLTVGLLGASIGTLVTANQKFDSAKTSCSPNCAQSVVDEISTWENAGWALVGCTGAMALGMVISAVLETPGMINMHKKVMVAPTANGLSVRF